MTPRRFRIYDRHGVVRGTRNDILDAIDRAKALGPGARIYDRDGVEYGRRDTHVPPTITGYEAPPTRGGEGWTA